MMPPLRSLKNPDAQRIYGALERSGVDVDALLAKLGLDLEDLGGNTIGSGPGRPGKHLELMELAAKQKGNRFLGVELGLDPENSNLGVLSYMLRNAPDFERAIDLLQRYVRLVAPGSTISLLEEDPQFILTYKISQVPPGRCIQATEMTIAQFVLLVRSLLRDDSWQPTRIYFEHCRPPAGQLKSFPLSCDLVFNHFFSGVCFPGELMQYANKDHDLELLAILEAQVQQSLTDLLGSSSLLDHVRLLISSDLGNEGVSANNVAVELGMSRRTLYRRLQESGTTFNKLREEVVLHLAKESLSGTKVSIAELAQGLGYSDSSAFNRAFKRLAGQKPLEYRKEHTMALSPPKG